jgi:precorrin-2 methylase
MLIEHLLPVPEHLQVIALHLEAVVVPGIRSHLDIVARELAPLSASNGVQSMLSSSALALVMK